MEPNPPLDRAMERFSNLVKSWSVGADSTMRKLASDGDGSSQIRRAPMWRAIGIAKESGEDSDWELAMELLAMAALDNTRPIMVASVALSSILRQGHDVPFQAISKLVEPILHERELGASGYDWENSFPLERSRQAWQLALDAASLSGSPAMKAKPKH